MKKSLLRGLWLMLMGIVLQVYAVSAQTTLTGTVKDGQSGEPLIGANVVILGTTIGVSTDLDGNFRLQSNSTTPPFTLIISVIGYESKKVEVTENGQQIDVELDPSAILGQEVVVSASRVEESILESPVTVEKMDIISVRQTASPDFYDAIANMKGVHANKGSLTFTSFNTRGFATNANVRFVQLIDGQDNSAPLLNFPTGNLVGISELDVESVELVPGAASALYGPNAFNGILFMNSKSPFEYQGVSAQVKTGFTRSEAYGSDGPYPMNNVSVRYAKAFNNKFAFKVNFSFLDAEDWRGNDYDTDRDFVNFERSNDPGISPDFDGLNLYGDEFDITVPINSALADAIQFGALAGLGIPADPTLAAGFRTLENPRVTRTGLREEDIIDDYEARSIKADAALHYKIKDNLEAIYSYRFGSGSTIYQGGEKYAIRGFSQQFHKAELRGDQFFVRAYATLTDAGDSYNMTALATIANENFSPSAAEWVPSYGVVYGLARLGLLGLQNPQVPLGTILSEEDAHRAARQFANRNIPAPGTPEFNEVIRAVREDRYFQRNPAGSRFIDQSRTYHAEGSYNFSNQIDWAEIIVGGNFRRYSLFSDGTIFNEDPETGENFERLNIDEYGFYVQAQKRLFNDKLKMTGSLRYDKNENFEGQITPRLSAVVKVAENHNIRSSIQTGFRNPDTQAQFIYFPATSGILLGGTESNAARYGLFNGGAISPRTGEVLDFDYVQPEQLTAFEIGYKGIIDGKVLIDANFYHNWYRDFINQQTVLLLNNTTHQGQELPGVNDPQGRTPTAFAPYLNAQGDLTSYGVGIGVTWNMPKGYVFNGNYNYAAFTSDPNLDEDFIPDFNTPNNRFNLSFSNREVFNNLGFNITYRWQEQFFWWNTFGQGNIPSFDTIDAQVSYKLESLKSIIKVGGTNMFGSDYRTNIGAPFIGQMYYLSITFDEFMN